MAITSAFDIPGKAIIDGEVVVVHEGRTNFSELQADLAKGRKDRLLYYAFDLLWLHGEDLRKSPQVARKALLKELLQGHEPPILYSEHVEGDGHELFEAASKLNYEGIVSKKSDAPYRSDRNEGWLKIKTVQKGKFPSLVSSKTLPASPHCILERRKAKTWSTWERSAQVGPERFPAKSGSSSIPRSARSQN